MLGWGWSGPDLPYPALSSYGLFSLFLALTTLPFPHGNLSSVYYQLQLGLEPPPLSRCVISFVHSLARLWPPNQLSCSIGCVYF